MCALVRRYSRLFFPTRSIGAEYLDGEGRCQFRAQIQFRRESRMRRAQSPFPTCQSPRRWKAAVRTAVAVAVAVLRERVDGGQLVAVVGWEGDRSYLPTCFGDAFLTTKKKAAQSFHPERAMRQYAVDAGRGKRRTKRRSGLCVWWCSNRVSFKEEVDVKACLLAPAG